MRQSRFAAPLLPLGFLFALALALVSRAAEVAVAWLPPTDSSDVASYIVRYGTVSGQYTAVTNVGLHTSAVFPDLPGGLTFYFSARSVDALGAESVPSNEVSVEIPGPPPQPIGAENVSFAQNTTSPPYPFWLAGLNGSTNWVLLAKSSDPTLLASADIVLTGTGSNRFVTLTPQPNRTGTGVVTLLATDFLTTNQTTFTVEITPPNLAPIVDAGAGTTVRTNLSYMLRGRASDDGLPRKPGKLTLRWSKVSGPGTVTFGNSNFAVTSVRLGSAGLYRLRLTASDGELSSSSDTIIRALLLSDVTPPVISDLTVTDVTSSTIALSWRTDEPTDDQVRYFIGNAPPTFSLLNQTPQTLHLVTLTNLAPDTPYTLIARSRDPSGNQRLSDPVTVRTLESTLLSALALASDRQTSAPSPGLEEGPRSGSLLRIIRTIPSGWSMIACPLGTARPTLANLFPAPPSGTFFLKFEPAAGSVSTNAFNGEEWLDPDMTLEAGTGGMLYNPSEPYRWTLEGTAGQATLEAPLTRGSSGGKQFLAFIAPYRGLLSPALEPFQFKAGDRIHRLRTQGNAYETSTYDGTRWDLVPAINVGEGVLLEWAP